MEDALWEFCKHSGVNANFVLILVLMEDALWDKHEEWILLHTVVLILVLMEDALWEMLKQGSVVFVGLS